MAVGTDIYRVQLFSRDGGGNFFQNVLQYLVAADGTDTPFDTADFLANAFVTAIVPKYADIMSEDSVIDAIACRKIGPTGGGNTYTKTVTTNGTVLKMNETGAVAVNLNLFTDLVAVHGHMYLGGLPQNTFADDGLVPAAATLIATLRTALLTTLTWGTAGTGDLAVYSRKMSLAEPVTGIETSFRPCALPRRTRPFG